MKPDWNDAPEWAKWLAMDIDGEWFWFAEKPIKGNAAWHSAPESKLCSPAGIGGYGELYIEQRPLIDSETSAAI